MNFFECFDKEHLLAAHRGYRSLYPENTMLSFKKALGRCDFLELDVQFSKDNIPIVFHDDKLFRCSDILKYKKYVKQNRYTIKAFTLEELKLFDISSWFYKKNPFNQNIKNEKEIQRIPTLEEVIIFAKKNNLPLNIEIKFNKHQKLRSSHIKIILDLVKKYDFMKSVIFSSFHHRYLKKIKKINKNFSIAALAHERYPKNNVKYLKKLGVDAYHINERLVNKDLIKEILDAGIFVNVYTVNDKTKQEMFYKSKIKAIFSDFL